MLFVYPPTFVEDTKLIYGYNFEAPSIVLVLFPEKGGSCKPENCDP